MARILVVDDSIVARTNLVNILKEANHDIVAEATDGQAGFDKYTELKPELVTMDITMPKLNGIECLKKIVESDPEAKVMMVSALGQGAKILEALNAGAKHYITKPFEADKVLEAINEVMGN